MTEKNATNLGNPLMMDLECMSVSLFWSFFGKMFWGFFEPSYMNMTLPHKTQEGPDLVAGARSSHLM